ncbi:hypothetical protein JTB14_009246 [Gonioctena quinquepunctata]|nr:hypothetical protein JTB14_009246 [Gonioctena quinquepunctata]
MVSRLPPYHCELNPIELVWTAIKKSVAARNTTYKFSDLKQLFEEAIAITREVWKSCLAHVIEKLGKMMWELDHIMEAQAEIEPIIIDFDESSSSTLSE